MVVEVKLLLAMVAGKGAREKEPGSIIHKRQIPLPCIPVSPVLDVLPRSTPLAQFPARSDSPAPTAPVGSPVPDHRSHNRRWRRHPDPDALSCGCCRMISAQRDWHERVQGPSANAAAVDASTSAARGLVAVAQSGTLRPSLTPGKGKNLDFSEGKRRATPPIEPDFPRGAGSAQTVHPVRLAARRADRGRKALGTLRGESRYRVRGVLCPIHPWRSRRRCPCGRVGQ